MPLHPNMQPKEFAAIFLRRKWLIIFSILFILFGASVYCVIVPEQFKSSTTILVVPQRVPEGYVRSTISVRIEDRLSTIRQQVLSRTTLVKVMDELGLFSNERKRMAIEDTVEMMRKRIEITVVESRRRDNTSDAFTLSFVHENRQMAMLTTSRLGSFFIDENLKTREQQAVGTTEFLESQLQETKVKLAEQEEKVKRYKMTFMGELPQQMDANLNMLRGFQDQFRANAAAIRSAEDRMVFQEAQIGSLERFVPTTVVREGGQVVVAPSQDRNQTLLTEFASKKEQLAALSARYTDRYPEVIKLRREVEQMEKRIVEEEKSAAQATGSGNHRATQRPAPAQDNRQREEIARLRAQVIASEAEISSLKKDRLGIQKNIEVLQEKIARSPKREQEMISITRDYDNLKRSYDELMRNKLEANLSQNLEKRQKGEQFQILDPANLPENPFKPDRKKVFGLALLIAMAFGFGGAIVLEMLDPTIRGVSEFKHFFGLPILASIPIIQDQEYNRRRTIRKAAVFGGIVSFTTAISIFLLKFSEKIRTILSF